MKTEKDLRIGLKFHTALKNTLTIQKHTEDFVTVLKESSRGNPSRTLMVPIKSFLRDWDRGVLTLLEKPLDQAFRELDEQLTANSKYKVCHHHNVREDRFFSAMVYRTCKDCGKALN